MGASEKKNDGKNVYLIITGIAVAVILAAVLIFAFAKPKAYDKEALEKLTYQEGITIEGVDVSGKTLKEAEPLIREKAEELIKNLNVSYTVNGVTYPMTAYELGASIDYAATMTEALTYGKIGDGEELKKAKERIKNGEANFPLVVLTDNDKTLESLKKHSVLYDTEPQNATFKVSTKQNSSALTCSGELEYVADVDGLTVHADDLAEKLCKLVTDDCQRTVSVNAELQTTPADISLEKLQENCQLIASFQTEFKSSAFGRRFNIWKMSTVVNGTVLEPGEQWSINEHAGDRTTENGWADAAGIKGGTYVDEPGGGICQVSTTLYGAVLRSELEVVERKHHSWPSTYVPVGLDATISTGAPDFIYANNTDYPVAVIVTTDGNDERTIKVSIYGRPLDYKLDFKSEIVKEIEPEPMQTTFDPSLSPGASALVNPRETGYVAEVYKYKYNKETGEQIGEPELMYTDEYKAYTGLMAYGPSPSPGAETAAPAPSQPAEPQHSKEPED